jgi:hypothetical protein
MKVHESIGIPGELLVIELMSGVLFTIYCKQK